MRRLVIALLAALAGIAAVAPAQAQDRIQVGRLSCEVSQGIGLVLGSQRSVSCVFQRQGSPDEYYQGTITRLGLDIGITARSRIEWLVFVASDYGYAPGNLRGTYVGGSGEATLGVGLGSNWLIGGSRRGIMLQPWSIQAQAGLNLAVGVAGLELR